MLEAYMYLETREADGKWIKVSPLVPDFFLMRYSEQVEWSSADFAFSSDDIDMFIMLGYIKDANSETAEGVTIGIPEDASEDLQEDLENWKIERIRVASINLASVAESCRNKPIVKIDNRYISNPLQKLYSRAETWMQLWTSRGSEYKDSYVRIIGWIEY